MSHQVETAAASAVVAARPSTIAKSAQLRRSLAALGIAACVVVNLGLLTKLTLSHSDFPNEVRLRLNNNNRTDHWDTNQVAIVNFVDNADQVYGVYSIQQQMAKHNISAAHVVIVNQQGIKKSFRDAIALWIGDKKLRLVNRSHIISMMASRGANLWKGRLI